MKVLLVANTLPPTDLSGVGEQVMQLATGLRDRGHEVEILGRGSRGAWGPKLLFPLTVVPPMVRWLRDFEPDVVQVHESDGALAALVVAVLGAVGATHPRLVALQQVSYLEEIRAVRPLRDGDRVIGRPGAVEVRFRWLKAPVQVLLGRLTAWLADRVLAPSRVTAAEIEADYGVTGVAVLPNVMAAKTAPGVAETDPAVRGEAEPYFLFVGRLRIRKGVEILLEALLDEGTGRVLIAGDGEHRSRLEARAEELGLGERVRFLGRMPAEGVRELMIGCRALVVPSIYEGMPLVVLEAMEAGVAVIASRASGIPEVVQDRVTGWLVPTENVGALSAALAEAWADESAARQRGLEGRRRLDQCFRPEIAAAEWERIVRAEGD